jgi:hypothetical protein
MQNWIPLIVAVIAATAALTGYFINARSTRLNEKARYYAEALTALERYKQLPYAIYRRHDSTAQTRAELAILIGDAQAAVSFHRRWLDLDSPTVGKAYKCLDDKAREVNRKYREKAFQTEPRTDLNIEDLGTSIDFPYDSESETDLCIRAMRQELKLIPRHWVRRRIASEVSARYSQQDRRRGPAPPD